MFEASVSVRFASMALVPSHKVALAYVLEAEKMGTSLLSLCSSSCAFQYTYHDSPLPSLAAESSVTPGPETMRVALPPPAVCVPPVFAAALGFALACPRSCPDTKPLSAYNHDRRADTPASSTGEY